MESLRPRRGVGSRVPEFVQEVAGTRLEEVQILRRHLHAPIPQPGSYGSPRMFLVVGVALPGAAIVEAKHVRDIRNLQERAELAALAPRIGDQVLVTQLGIHSRLKSPARLARQAYVPVPPKRGGTERRLRPTAKPGQPLACRPPLGTLPAQDR